MADLLFVALIVGLFAVAALLVRACEHLIGPEEVEVLAAPADDQEVAA